MEKVDILIVGAGVIGLAAAYALSGRNKEIMVIDRNTSFGQEASSRNSEVIHAGIYYPKGSLKAQTCIRGKELLYDLCKKNNIGHKKLGKLIIASNKDEALALDDLCKNAVSCSVKNLKFLDKKDIKKLEPDIRAEKALFSPDSGIMDTHGLMKFLSTRAKERDADFSFGVEAVVIEKNGFGYKVTVKEPGGETFSFNAGTVINAAGFNSDKVAAFVGIDPEKCGYKIHYSKGQYFRIKNPGKFSVEHLVYPPPGKTYLGIHITPDLAGGLRLGPDERYVDEIDHGIDEKDKENFHKSVSRFLPGLEKEDIIPDTAGIRAKLQREDGDFRDFVIQNEEERGFSNFVNLIGIESPGLTSCLAIAERVSSCLNIR